MKTGVLFAALVLVLGCNKSSDVLSAQLSFQLNEPFQLKVGQTAVVNNDLVLSFESVPSDSRCAKGVECIWAGMATVVLRYSDGVDTLNTLVTTATVHGNYVIKMDSLTPYPVYPGLIPKDDYVVALIATNKLK